MTTNIKYCLAKYINSLLTKILLGSHDLTAAFHFGKHYFTVAEILLSIRSLVEDSHEISSLIFSENMKNICECHLLQS